MFIKLVSGFCNKTKRIDNFATLRAIMNPPTPENHQRLTLTVKQLTQSQQVNWKMVCRLQELQDQYSIQVDFPYLIKRLSEFPIDTTKSKFIVEIMLKHFTLDENYFTDIFYQLCKEQELQYQTLIKLLHVYFEYPEFLNQDIIIPRLIQNLLAYSDEVEVYDIMNALQVMGFSDELLNETNKEWLNDLKSEICNQLVKLMPCLGQKQFRQLIQIIRSSKYENELLRQAIFNYFKDHKLLFGQSSLIELLNLCNTQFYQNDDLKYQILISINFLKIKGVNESKLINRYIIPNLPLSEQEIMANLITLSGIQLDREYFLTYYVDSNSKRREKIEQLEGQNEQVTQIIQEIETYINQKFTQFMNVLKLAQSFAIDLPQLMVSLSNQLAKILENNIVDSNEALQALNYLEQCNVLCKPTGVGMEHLKKYLINEPYTQQKITYLQREYVFNPSEEIMNVLNKAIFQTLNLELLSRQALIYDHYKQVISNEFEQHYHQATLQYVEKKHSAIEQIYFYKLIQLSNWANKLKPELHSYYIKGEKNAITLKKPHSKPFEETASLLETEIKMDLLKYMPKQFKLLSNQLVNGTDVDFIISNQKGDKLYFQIHGTTHFYQGTTELNYLTRLENLKMSRLGYFTYVSHFDLSTKWHAQKENAVKNLLSCF